MSIEAISWALNLAAIPRDRRDASSLTIVLVGLANHADPDGRNAYPSLARLGRYTRLSERSIRFALRTLQELGLIRASNPSIVAANFPRGAPTTTTSPSTESSLLWITPATRGTVCRPLTSTRGKEYPRNVLNRPENRPARKRAPGALAAAAALPSVRRPARRPGAAVAARPMACAVVAGSVNRCTVTPSRGSSVLLVDSHSTPHPEARRRLTRCCPLRRGSSGKHPSESRSLFAWVRRCS
ncbi:MAG TPA: helix-turn-helix domain-containing protein [Amycolatopsis sp.]|nr:helix-turn-helix domain-containing protein [Amycolatopsis sp.]